MPDNNAEPRQPGPLNPQALRLEDLARILSASGQRPVSAEMIEVDVDDGAPLDGRQRKHREGCRGQLEALEEEEHRADRRDRGPVMPLDRASTQPPPERSVYEERGFLYI